MIVVARADIIDNSSDTGIASFISRILLRVYSYGLQAADAAEKPRDAHDSHARVIVSSCWAV